MWHQEKPPPAPPEKECNDFDPKKYKSSKFHVEWKVDADFEKIIDFSNEVKIMEPDFKKTKVRFVTDESGLFIHEDEYKVPNPKFS